MNTIDNDVKITINLSDLVNIRADFLDLDYDDLDTCDRENITNELRTTLTWDTLYYMVDNALLEYAGLAENHYGETAGDEPAKSFEAEQKRKKKEFEKNFEMVDLVSSSWTIQVPRRK